MRGLQEGFLKNTISTSEIYWAKKSIWISLEYWFYSTYIILFDSKHCSFGASCFQNNVLPCILSCVASREESQPSQRTDGV